MAYEKLYVAFLVYFNRDRDYFECHEVLEELWLARERDPLYKGLLQVAVGLYHFRNGNVRGGTLLLSRAVDKLEDYPAQSLGINLAKLVSEARDYAKRLESYNQQSFPYYDLTIDIVDDELVAAVESVSPGIKTNIPQRRGPQRPQASYHK